MALPAVDLARRLPRGPMMLRGCPRCEGALAWREAIDPAFRGRELCCINCGAIVAYEEPYGGATRSGGQR